MPIGAQPPGRRGTLDQPYSPLNLRLVLAAFGFVICTVLSVLSFRAGWAVAGWLLAAWALVAVIDMIVVQFRRRARKRIEGGHHAMFE